jgi:hypothetical protein
MVLCREFQVRCDKRAVRSREQDVRLECDSVLDVKEPCCRRQYSRCLSSVGERVRKMCSCGRNYTPEQNIFAPFVPKWRNLRVANSVVCTSHFGSVSRIT